MKIIIILLIAIILTLPGCITTQKKLCPPEDVVFPVYTPMGYLTVKMEKGFFTDETKGKKWMTLTEFNRLIEQKKLKRNNETIPFKKKEINLWDY